MSHSREYPATVPAVKRGLKRIGYTQDRAARAIGNSPGLVSGVLARKIKSQPCLDRLAALIAAQSQVPDAAPAVEAVSA